MPDNHERDSIDCAAMNERVASGELAPCGVMDERLISGELTAFDDFDEVNRSVNELISSGKLAVDFGDIDASLADSIGGWGRSISNGMVQDYVRAHGLDMSQTYLPTPAPGDAVQCSAEEKLDAKGRTVAVAAPLLTDDDAKPVAMATNGTDLLDDAPKSSASDHPTSAAPAPATAGSEPYPATKKRTAERQITKDDEDDNEHMCDRGDCGAGGEDDVRLESGTFQRASEEVMKKRRIVKVGRDRLGAAASAAAASAAAASAAAASAAAAAAAEASAPDASDVKKDDAADDGDDRDGKKDGKKEKEAGGGGAVADDVDAPNEEDKAESKAREDGSKAKGKEEETAEEDSEAKMKQHANPFTTLSLTAAAAPSSSAKRPTSEVGLHLSQTQMGTIATPPTPTIDEKRHHSEEHISETQNGSSDLSPSQEGATAAASNQASVVSSLIASAAADDAIAYTKLDVLLGRGGLSNHHPGNQRFRDVVKNLKPEYLDATTTWQKTEIRNRLVDTVLGYGGRFLQEDKPGGRWSKVKLQRARRKASQALREEKKKCEP